MFNIRNKIFSLFNIIFHPYILVSIRWKMVTMLQFLIFAFIVFKRTDFSSYFISIWNFHVLLLKLSIVSIIWIAYTIPAHPYTYIVHGECFQLKPQFKRVLRDYLVKCFVIITNCDPSTLMIIIMIWNNNSFTLSKCIHLIDRFRYIDSRRRDKPSEVEVSRA